MSAAATFLPEPLPQVSVSTLKVGMAVDSVYVLKSSEQRTTKGGDPFFTLQFADATGTVNGVLWNAHDGLAGGQIQRDDYVRVSAQVGEFNNAPQLNVKKIARVEESAVDASKFLPVSPRPRAEMEAELDELIARVKDKDCARILAKMFGHPKIREAYCTAPAAARLHQAYLHGLLDHTLNVVKHALHLAPMYEPVNYDVLITGALLHDIGKVKELSWKRTIGYTDEGRLYGHITIGTNMVEAACRELAKEDAGFDDNVRRHVVHLILSHHGKLEWGSPVTPKTREAMLLHFADYTDAYMIIATDEMRRAMAKGEQWTPFVKMFDSYLYAGAPPSNLPLAPAMPPPPESAPFDDTSARTAAAEFAAR